MLKMSSCAHSPSERMCWIVRGGEERYGERCGKVCWDVGEVGKDVGVWKSVGKEWKSNFGCRERCEKVLGVVGL